jgi:flagellar biosynthesis protein FlhA
MAKQASTLQLPRALFWIARHRHLLVPLSFLAMLIVLVVPMPPAVMDILICANLSLATVILLTTIYMTRPLDFSVFPSLLLATTLFRLVLNVGSTRLILSTDATTPEEASTAAGHVINAFAHFVAGESPIVGAIIFVILVIVQFVVITKGATRMSEVAARFTLDAMPGKQMAIDADLSAGLINEEEAKARRESIMREADFYGAMDGASKFVRGDAIAGIIITLVNIAGGFAIGWLDKGWTMTESLKVFTMLTIGDGLVSQVPAFVIAIAAGLIVARTGGKQTLGDEMPRQLASQPTALYLIAGFLATLSFTPLPAAPMLLAAALVGGLAWSVGFTERQQRIVREAQVRSEAARKPPEQTPVEELLQVDTMELEIGYGLVQLVDSSRGGDLLDRIALIRRQLATEPGIVVPPVRIRDNMQLEAASYRAKLRGATIGSGTIYPDLMMAMDSGVASGRLEGLPGKEPAFGLDAIWIDPSQKSRAESLNYTVVDPASVLATHLTELIKEHAAELLTREEVNRLLDQLKNRAGKLVSEAVPGAIKPGEIQRVMQNLLRERVPVRDLETIVETLADWSSHTKDLDVLTEYVRNALRRTICEMHSEPGDDGRPRLHCITLDPDLEEQINGYIDRSPAGTTLTMPSRMTNQICAAVSEAAAPLVSRGRQMIVLTSPSVRAQVKQILDTQLPGSIVLSYNEIVKGLDVESVGLVHLPESMKAFAGVGAA